MYKYSNIRSSGENVGQIRRNCLRNFFWAFPHLYLGPSWIAEFAFSLWPEEATFDFSHKTHISIQHVIVILEDFVQMF